jgi:hypothetical protein
MPFEPLHAGDANYPPEPSESIAIAVKLSVDGLLYKTVHSLGRLFLSPPQSAHSAKPASPTYLHAAPFAHGVGPSSLACAPSRVFNAKDELHARWTRRLCHRQVDQLRHTLPSPQAFVAVAVAGMPLAESAHRHEGPLPGTASNSQSRPGPVDQLSRHIPAFIGPLDSLGREVSTVEIGCSQAESNLQLHNSVSIQLLGQWASFTSAPP